MPAAFRTHIDVLDIGGRALCFAFAFEQDVILLAFIDIGGYPARAKHGFQGAADIAYRDTQIGSTVIIDHYLHLRFGLFVVIIQTGETWIVLVDLCQQDIAPLGELFVGAAADNKLHRFLNACAETLAHHRKGFYPGQVTECYPDFIHDLPGGAARIPVV